MATTPSASRGEIPRPREERKPLPESGSTVTEHLENGAVVTYFDPSASAERSFRRAVAIGPDILDPCTNVRWIPLIGNDWRLDMVMWPLVVDIAPS